MARAFQPRSRSKIEVQGVKVIQRQLRRMDDGTVQELKRVYFLSANLVAKYAEPRIPRRTGNLASTMRVTASKAGGWVKLGGKRTAPYAGPIHFGWPNRPNLAKDWYGGPIRPNPFLYSALDERREEVNEAFYRGIMKVARKAGLDPQ
jgi:hypothetical protein